MNFAKKINSVAFILITIILIVFDIYKASHASFTMDESDTYLHWVNDSFIDIISYQNPGTNNHILNTLLMKLFQVLFGTSELILRLPNIIAHIFYLIFSFKIFNRYSKPPVVILFFILMNGNPFMIDFFSLARGYGIAIALMMSGFYFYCRYIEDQKNKYHILTLLFVCLAAIANFALISLVLVFIFTHNLLQFFVFKHNFSFKGLWKANYINLIFFFLLLALCYEPIRKIIQLKLLFFGGIDGFWIDTVGSMAETFSYFSPYQYYIIIGCKILVVGFSVLFMIRSVLYIFRKKPINLTQKFVLFFGLNLFLIVLVSVLQHFFLDTPFMMERFAVFLYPIFILMGSFLIIDILVYSYKYITSGLLVLLTTLFFWHTCYSLNLSWYYKWSCERYTKDMLTDLGKIKQCDPSAKITLGGYWMFFSTLEFYVKIWKWDWVTMDYIQAEMYENEYFYFVERDFNNFPHEEWEIIHHYQSTDILYHNYQSANNYLVKYIKAPQSKSVSN